MILKVSKASVWTTLAATLGTMIVCSAAGFLLAPTLYHIQLSQTKTTPGSVGTPAQETTPIVSSIEQMQQSDRFTIRVSKNDVVKNKSDRRKWGNKVYYRIQLESGESIAVDIYFPSITELPDGKTMLLPIGEWKKWKHSKEDQKHYDLYDVKGDYRYYETFDYYVDMAGDIGYMPTKDKAQNQIMGVLLIPVMLLFIWGIRSWAVKKGLMEPEFLTKKFNQEADKTIPKDDLERWLVASYAIYAEYLGSYERIGGLRATPKHKKILCQMLARDWGIENREDAIEWYHRLMDVSAYVEHGSMQEIAWDLVRANQLMGIFYLCDFVSRDELRSYGCLTGQKMQKYFQSWNDLCENYLQGYAEWSSTVFSDAQKKIAERQEIYEYLRSLPDSPYKLNWRMHMYAAPEENTCPAWEKP